MRRQLKDLATVIRSKNAGPYELTFDIIFKSPAVFRQAREEDLITRELIRTLYRVTDGEILGIVWFEPAAAVKVTIARGLSAGAVGESDVYGAQQHMPLVNTYVDWKE